MIHMLSRFDLKPGFNPGEFAENYARVVDDMRAEGLAEATGAVGRRERGTPMDTDAVDAQEFYAVMTFRDRAQLDAAYERLLGDRTGLRRLPSHEYVKQAVSNPVFTCWADLD